MTVLSKSEKNHRYHFKHREQRLAYFRDHYRRNRERKLTKARARHAQKRASDLERQRLYRRENALAVKIANTWRIPIDIAREIITTGESLPP